MRLFHPLTLSISLRYGFFSKAHKFATFVAILSIIGIAIGVAALIIDTSIMQGLQNRLKKAVLKDTPHVIVKSPIDSSKLLSLDHVIATAPFVNGQALLQANKTLALINLEGLDDSRISVKNQDALSKLSIVDVPQKNSFELNGEAALYLKNEIRLGSKVRVISTINARYTPMGLTPTQRLFTLKTYHPSTNATALDTAVGNFEDVRRLFRIQPQDTFTRMWLDDPFKIEDVRSDLNKLGVKYSDWTEVQGEFFKAVAMEKLTMSIMLCLIILVAAFNILSALTMMVSARLTEIAILKTLGLKRGQILTIFLMMGMFAGILGTLIGIALGIPLTHTISANMSNTQTFGELPAAIELQNLLYIGLGSILMSLIFTIYPAYKAAKTDPVSNLARGS